MIKIIEIKARCKDANPIRQLLEEKNADFKGIDHQIDTYFKVANGRMKLREGNIENTLIFYNRPNQAGPKKSEVLLYKPEPKSTLKSLLTAANEVLAVVDKQRSIYFIDNVKFHIDEVKELGSFIEIEAIDEQGIFTEGQLNEQCQHYLDLFGVKDADLVEVSYSDLMMAAGS